MSERALLAAALRAHLARRRAMGMRRVDVVGAAGAAAAPPAQATSPGSPVPIGGSRTASDSPPATTRERPTSAPPASTPASSASSTPAARTGPGVIKGEPATGRPAELAPGCSDLESLRAAVAACTACSLAETRTQTVFCDGTAPARVMFIGEAPGFYEDQKGVPFVGKAGALLTDIITKGMGLRREDVFIANVLKCRPPDNRDPRTDEKGLCTPWLDRQIDLVDPDVLIPLGRHAANHVLGTELPMGRLRGQVHEVRGRKVVPTYHPAYLLRNPADKRACWEDIQRAMEILGLQRG